MILEAYLNIAPLTGTLSGMQAGAQQYFGKDASQLTLAESATLASIPAARWRTALTPTRKSCWNGATGCSN